MFPCMCNVCQIILETNVLCLSYSFIIYSFMYIFAGLSRSSQNQRKLQPCNMDVRGYRFFYGSSTWFRFFKSLQGLPSLPVSLTTYMCVCVCLWTRGTLSRLQELHVWQKFRCHFKLKRKNHRPSHVFLPDVGKMKIWSPDWAFQNRVRRNCISPPGFHKMHGNNSGHVFGNKNCPTGEVQNITWFGWYSSSCLLWCSEHFSGEKDRKCKLSAAEFISNLNA